jgi:hypothetical protein
VPDPYAAGYRPSVLPATPPGIPAPWPSCWTQDHRDRHHQSVPDPSLKQVPQLTGIPTHPPEPTTLHASLSPSHAWDNQNPSHPSELPGSSLCGTTGVPPCWDRHHPGVRQMHPQDCQEPCSLYGAAPALQASQITSQPGYRWAASRGLQVCLIDTHRLDWTLKN